MQTYEYTVTNLAGSVVAGHRVKAGDCLALTELEAQSELMQGTLVKQGETLHEAFTKPNKVMTSLNEEAQAFKTRNISNVEQKAEQSAAPLKLEPDVPASQANQKQQNLVHPQTLFKFPHNPV